MFCLSIRRNMGLACAHILTHTLILAFTWVDMSLYPLTLVFISLFAHLFRFESPLFHAAPHEIFGDCQLYSNFVATCVVFVRCLALSHAPPPHVCPLSGSVCAVCCCCCCCSSAASTHCAAQKKRLYFCLWLWLTVAMYAIISCYG